MKLDSAPVLPDTADVHSAQPSPAESDSESDTSDSGAWGLKFDGGCSDSVPMRYCSGVLASGGRVVID